MPECCDKCLLKCFAVNVDLETLKHQHCVIQHSLRSWEIRKNRFKYHHFHSIFSFSVLLCALQAFSLSLFCPLRDFLGKLPADVYLSKRKHFLLYFPPTWSLRCLSRVRVVCCCYFCGCVFAVFGFGFGFCGNWSWIIEINGLPFSDCWVISCSFWWAGDIITASQAYNLS